MIPYPFVHQFAYLIIHHPSIHVVSQALSIKFNNCYMPNPMSSAMNIK